jgi:hypothetical protein
MIQYSGPFDVISAGGDYWMPAFAGMTALPLVLSVNNGERFLAALPSSGKSP